MLKIDYIFSSDVSNLETWIPLNEEEIFIGVEIEVKWDNEEESSIFQTIIVSPEALLKRSDRFVNPLNLKGYIVISDYSWGRIRNYIEDLVEKANVSNQKEKSLSNMVKFFFWEYEDHTID